MFSVIIPTLWKSKRIFKLLDDLKTSKKVNEIIIINNDDSKKPNFNFEDIRIITPEQNIYVNPSWNLGVKESKNNYICLCNDDINFNPKIFSYLKPRNDSIIGIDESCYNLKQDEDFKLKTKTKMNHGFGCLMFLNKQSYKVIPEFLKIYFGDDYLFQLNQNRYALNGLKIDTEMSSSSNIPNYYNITQEDRVNFNKHMNK